MNGTSLPSEELKSYITKQNKNKKKKEVKEIGNWWGYLNF